MISVLIALLPISASAPAPLLPNGPWQVAYEESMCLAARRYGAAGDVTVGFRPGPLSDFMEISIDLPRWPGRLMARSKADLHIARSDQRFLGSYEAQLSIGGPVRAIVVNTSNELLDQLVDGDALTISTQPHGRLAIKLGNMAKLKAALTDCRSTLLKHWGVDLVALRMIAEPARPASDIALWINYADYPQGPLRRGERGTSNILWTIGTDGIVRNCRVVATSGSPELDQAACGAIVKRGRYLPAKDVDGRPIQSWANRRVRWRAFAP